MDEEHARGSQFLTARYSEGDLEELLAAGEHVGVQLVDFFPIGVPAFEGGSGTWTVTPEQLPALIQALTRVGRPPHMIVIPKGLPAVDSYDVVFEAGTRRSR
jgi:hypothetical protein